MRHLAVPALAAFFLCLTAQGVPAQGQCGDGAVYPACQPPTPVDANLLYAMVRNLTGQDQLHPNLQEPVDALAARSQWLVVRADGLRIRSLHGMPLGNVALADPLDPAGAYPAALEFLATHADLFRLTPAQRNGLAADFLAAETRVGDHVRIRLEQLHQGLRVFDGGFVLRFMGNGQLHSLWGSPISALELPDDITPQIAEAAAVAIALQEVADLLQGTPWVQDLLAAPELVVQGEGSRLLWSIRVTHPEAPGIDYAVRVDAHAGTVLAVVNTIDADTVVKPIPVRNFSHLFGQKDDRVDPLLADNPDTHLLSINVNAHEYSFFSNTLCKVRLQRLGSGRARMWNADLMTGTIADPVFGYTSTWTFCSLTPFISNFEQRPDQVNPYLVIDADNQFNEQQTYAWAQRLKTQVDNWGRQPGAESGYYYPVVAERAENFEIVVNAPSSAETAWCGGGVMHGCSVNNCGSTCASRFQDVTDTPHIVYLFNDSGNWDSPQFVGPEYSATYSIIAHEVGHSISWQYGRPSSSTTMRRSRSEGWSMALPALWGKDRWTASLDYDDSLEVTTGSRAGTGHQWEHHAPVDAERYDTQDCDDADPYRLAWPWVQAMWELANNRNAETGDPVWATDAQAIENTADLFMDAMYDLADSTSANWNDVSAGMYIHEFFRMLFHPDKGGSIASYSELVSILDHHGLLDDCL